MSAPNVSDGGDAMEQGNCPHCGKGLPWTDNDKYRHSLLCHPSVPSPPPAQAVPAEWMSHAAAELLWGPSGPMRPDDDLSIDDHTELSKTAAIIARHCPVGCAANEVGTVEPLARLENGKLVPATVVEWNAIIAERDDLREQHEKGRQASLNVLAEVEQLRDQLAALDKDYGVLLDSYTELKRTPAPTVPVGEWHASLKKAATRVADCYFTERGEGLLEAMRRLDSALNPPFSKRALTVPTGTGAQGKGAKS